MLGLSVSNLRSRVRETVNDGFWSIRIATLSSLNLGPNLDFQVTIVILRSWKIGVCEDVQSITRKNMWDIQSVVIFVIDGERRECLFSFHFSDDAHERLNLHEHPRSAYYTCAILCLNVTRDVIWARTTNSYEENTTKHIKNGTLY